MRRTIQTHHGEIKLDYEGAGVYRAPLPRVPGRDYIVFHDRQLALFKVIEKVGKKITVIGSGKDLDEACEIIRAHTEYAELKKLRRDKPEYN
jgi:hypothetical protein